MKISHEAHITIESKTTFGDIQAATAGAEIPTSASVRVDKYAGDQRDPGYTRLIFRWETTS